MSTGSGNSSPSIHSPSASTAPPVLSKGNDDFVPRQEDHSPKVVQPSRAQTSPSYPQDTSHSADDDSPVSNGNVVPRDRPITSPSPSARAALSGVSQRTALEENAIQERFRRDQDTRPRSSNHQVDLSSGRDDEDDDVRLAYDEPEDEVNAGTNTETNAEGWVPEGTLPPKTISAPKVAEPLSKPLSTDLAHRDLAARTPPGNSPGKAVGSSEIKQGDSRRPAVGDFDRPQNGGESLESKSMVAVANAKVESAEQNRLAEEERQRRKRIDLEAARLHAERAEVERVEQQRAESERLQAEQAEKERIEAERIRTERVERDRVEAERAEKKRIEAERVERDRLEAERITREEVEEGKRMARERALRVEEQERERARRVEEQERERARRVEEQERERARLEAEQREVARQRRESIGANMSKGKAHGGLMLQGVGQVGVVRGLLIRL